MSRVVKVCMQDYKHQTTTAGCKDCDGPTKTQFASAAVVNVANQLIKVKVTTAAACHFLGMDATSIFESKVKLS
jgi:hypothetical protein